MDYQVDLAVRILVRTPDVLRTGRHPSLGTVSLSHHLAMWVVHDLGHLAQIARAMAWQYREAIGPWFASTRIVQPER